MIEKSILGNELTIWARSADEYGNYRTIDVNCLSPDRRQGLIARIEPVASNSNGNQSEYLLILKNTAQQLFSGIVRVDLEIESQNPAFFMPGFLYNRNRGNVPAYYGHDGATALFPRLSLEKSGIPYSDFWMVRADRLSHPVSMMWEGENAYGISVAPVTEDGDFRGFCCRLGKTKSSIGFTLGYENAPVLYVEAHTVKEPTAGYIQIQPGRELRVRFWVYHTSGSDERIINAIIRKVYRQYHTPPRKGADLGQAASDIAQAIFEDAYVDRIKNYSTRVFLENGKVVHEPLASISWTGGVEVAVPLLRAAHRMNRADMRLQAAGVIDHIVRHSLNPRSGLPYDAWSDGRWRTDGWWDDRMSQSGHSSYLVGQALYYILTAFHLEMEYDGQNHQDWRSFVYHCLKRIALTEDNNGELPYIWSQETGEGLEYDSFAGCWCTAAAALYGALNQDAEMLSLAGRGVRHYWEKFVRRMECYGTPIDTFKAVDSEGALAFIKACRWLHQATGQAEYLAMLKDGLEYEFTFKFCWNPPIQAEPLKRLNWSCCGGSVTSVCNPHIHPMSNNVCDELVYCALNTKDDYFMSRLKDTVNWALQAYSMKDGEYDFGKKGWMSERFCYSEGLLTELYEDGSPCSTWRCFLPWGASNILEGLCGTVWDEIYHINA